jgi:hypothetical protein
MTVSRIAIAVALALIGLAGCDTFTAGDVRARARFQGNYQSAEGYEAIYRRILGLMQAETGRMPLLSSDVTVDHALFPEAGEAEVSLASVDAFGERTTWVLVEIRRRGTGSALRAYAIYEDWWQRLDGWLRQAGAEAAE